MSRKSRKRALKRARRLQEALWPNTTFVLPRRVLDRTVSLEAPADGQLRLIFCDFDGVLNQHSKGKFELSPEHVARLDYLAAVTGAQVVVSSWWRWVGVSALRSDLASAGFTGRVIGRTPWLGETEVWDAYERGTEISAVLDYLGDRVAGFVILDDHDRMGDLLPHLVQTDATEGLTDIDVERARLILALQPGDILSRELYTNCLTADLASTYTSGTCPEWQPERN